MAQSPPGPKPSPPPPPKQPAPKPSLLAPMRSVRFWIVIAALFALNIIFSTFLSNAGQPPTVTISYSTFLQQVQQGNVTSITATTNSITGTAKNQVTDASNGTKSTKFQTERPTFATDDLLTLLQQHGVSVNASNPNAAT